ncbi:MAG TPA: A/G-specific adenine glycosylase [Candidatus Paceibacterota bacterium]
MQPTDILLKELKAFYKKEGRNHLPWRKTKDLYKILVSEIMLQQTQVERVVPFYTNFIKQFPTSAALAKAPLSKVLKAWQGLGYNRRAKFLHEAAKMLSAGAKEFFPSSSDAQKNSFAPALSTEFLESLPGVGHYTARAISTFAYNKPEVFIETNIRTVFFCYCYTSVLQKTATKKVSDAELLPLIEKALTKSKMQPHDFYAALMDYGAYLKASGVKLNSRSKHYVKQSKFEGSARQLRGAILRELLKKPATLAQLTKNLSRSAEEVERQLHGLQLEKITRVIRGQWCIAG